MGFTRLELAWRAGQVNWFKPWFGSHYLGAGSGRWSPGLRSRVAGEARLFLEFWGLRGPDGEQHIRHLPVAGMKHLPPTVVGGAVHVAGRGGRAARW